ncbi:hypothetical protein EN839_23845 [Mesorhizobium sp. M1C.F.Ca.ET.196.01.1.1]|nr:MULTISPECIES: hypothetical protein [unclassified Mesorhizobium]TGR22965.1 hypothetical protein EN839_23845 [Mesorhizobium sp. M1C.F.Ca.ET.196.01.1.1]TGR45732.1 hypothetical protein EN838_23845 [Mesorhizobium sp. M1C.F.Ca.ET.195.01.1.1]TGS24197.1 hypothetical protein EN830_23850 [Mesorhizobium sp. M1C.F.Ca.ET.187.01.1.1]TGR00915.1 hypothetical protein EN843_30295 [Mesorhizobium sp. M4B.F.Ca.ET.200.01.1.1]TGR62630.1 hypothetical protein EN835_023840 [Mesorhizobium sp. M1C.F.Ca.ET.192.01.1.1]
MLDHPADVAFCSMRELARKAAAGHATMMWLALWEEIPSRYRAIFAAGSVRPPVGALPDLDVHVEPDNVIATLARQTSPLAEGREFSQHLVECSADPCSRVADRRPAKLGELDVYWRNS